jgi:translocation and assembly module TamA
MSFSQGRPLLLLCLILLATPLLALPGSCAPVEYAVEIPDLPDGLTPLLSSVSDCVNLKENPPDTLGLLRKRMANDIESFITALQARGYFKAQVTGELDTDVSPPSVRFLIEPGARFVFEKPRLILLPDDSAREHLRDALHRIRAGEKYSSGTILDVETALLERLKEHGYPSPVAQEKKIIADHATDRVSVSFTIDTGPAATFGSTQIQGLEDVAERVVTSELAWEEGRPFDRRKVDRTREQLIRTGLFRSVRIEAEHPEGSSTVNMNLTLLEAPHRSVRAGLWYYSDLGLGTDLGWAHRNIFGAGQELRIDAELAETLQRTKTDLILPRMWHPRQNLGLSAQYEHELTDSYDSTNLSLSALMRRPLSELQVGYGLAYRLTEVDNDDEVRRFNLFSIPLIAEFTNADNLLDPTSGVTLAARMEPFTDIGQRETSFVLWNLSGRHYLPLTKNKSIVLATRGRYSLLAGTNRDSIPEDMLLYAGGGGSIRGYAHQYAGELDEDDDPLGGVSAVDFSAELRFRINREYGVALFGDGGGAFSGRNPSDREDYFWGVGAGLRYFTPIGPIRADVAVPLERREDVDSLFQIYISLGQAF